MDNVNEMPQGVGERGRESLPRKKVEVPEDCWIDVLRFLTCFQWTEKRLVSWKINGIAERNISRLPCAVLERAIFEEYSHCRDRKTASNAFNDLIVANEINLPPNEIMQWFAERSIILGIPENKKEVLADENNCKFPTVSMYVLGPAQRFEVRNVLVEKRKLHESLVFYAQCHLSKVISWHSLETFLTFLFYPLTYVKEVEIDDITQEYIDGVKRKIGNYFSVHETMSRTDKTFYIRCGLFSFSTTVVAKDNNHLHQLFEWLVRNVRADSIYLSFDFDEKNHVAVCRLLNNFVFGELRICARRELKLRMAPLNLELLTSFIETFWTLPPIEYELPGVVIDTFSSSDFRKVEPNLGLNIIDQEVDSQGAKFLYVLENEQNRMRISFWTGYYDYWSVVDADADYDYWSSEVKYICYVKFYTV